MLDDIRSALAEIGRGYADRRVQVCRLGATALDWGRCALTGTVLDATTLAAVLAQLAARFPDLAFTAEEVTILRRPEPRYMRVATNLTGLYAEPSFLAEQLSQLLNGQRLEVLQEEERWCFVRQDDGYLGWAYRPYLADGPDRAATHLIAAPVSLLRERPADAAVPVTRVLAPTAVAVDAAEDGWLRVALVGGQTGWATAADLRPLSVLPVTEDGRRQQVVADAQRFIGVPYLWGGCTALGIDCSGFAQLVHRLSGLILPRDADMQYASGRPVEPPFRPGDLLFFGERGESSRVTHVAISLGGWRILHSSRSRNGVYEDDVQAVAHLRDSLIGARTFVAEVG